MSNTIIVMNKGKIQQMGTPEDIYNEPKNAKVNAEYIGYSIPNIGALELLDKEITSNPVAYPSKELLDKCETFVDVRKNIKIYDRAWIELKSK